MKSKKLLSLMLICTLLFSLLLTACSNGSSEGDNNSQETITIKVANGEAVGQDRDLSIVKFKELVEEKSDGKIKVEVFSGGTLGGWRDTIEGLEVGLVQCVVESIGTLEAYSPTAAIDAFPFLYKSIEDYERLMLGETGQKILDAVGEEGGFTLLAPSYRGARVLTATKKVENLDDLKGLKLRAPGLDMYLKTWQTLGAAPIPMDMSEVYTGIQQGTVSGQENPLAVCYGNAFYEVCDYLMITNHVISSDVFIFNDDYFAGLPEEYQTIIKESAEEAAAYRTELVKENEAEYIKQFEEKGVEVVYPNIDEFVQQFENFESQFPHIESLVKEIKAAQ